MGRKFFAGCNDSIPGYIFPDLVCVHSTHKTNEYGYKLVAFLVVDEYKNG